MYYIKLDNKLDRTIERKISIFEFLIKNNINKSNDVEIAIYKNSNYCFSYAKYVLNGRFELGEKIISQDSYNSYYYAERVLEGRFEQGEPSIAKYAAYSYSYAVDVLNDRFELGEPSIAKDPNYSYWYAKDILKSRFYIAEEAIKNSLYKEEYEKYFGIKLY